MTSSLLPRPLSALFLFLPLLSAQSPPPTESFLASGEGDSPNVVTTESSKRLKTHNLPILNLRFYYLLIVFFLLCECVACPFGLCGMSLPPLLLLCHLLPSLLRPPPIKMIPPIAFQPLPKKGGTGGYRKKVMQKVYLSEKGQKKNPD